MVKRRPLALGSTPGRATKEVRIKECRKPEGFGGDGVTTPTPFNSFDAEVQGAVAVIFIY